jgi:hypothetical protein
MASIIHRLRDIALSMCGLESINHASADFTQRVLDDANRSIHECSVFVENRYSFEEPRGVYVQPKVVTTAGVTHGSTAMTGIVPSAWMAGCTIQIEGSPVFNRIRKVGADYVLARPYLGSTGTKNVTIWHDNIQLPSDVAAVKGPFHYGDKTLELANSDAIRDYIGEPTNRAGVPSYVATVASKVGDAAILVALLLDALPEGGSEVVYTASGIIANFADLNDTRESIMPLNLEASILLPIFRFHFGSYPGAQADMASLAQSYQIAQQALERTPARSGTGTLVRPKR